jgi:hypothetical protein
VREEVFLASLLTSIEHVQISNDEPSWMFCYARDGRFLVKANYSFLLNKLSPLTSFSLDQAFRCCLKFEGFGIFMASPFF